MTVRTVERENSRLKNLEPPGLLLAALEGIRHCAPPDEICARTRDAKAQEPRPLRADRLPKQLPRNLEGASLLLLLAGPYTPGMSYSRL